MSKADFEQVTPKDNESLVFKAHDYPHPLSKWHYHPEYEIHLIQKTSGKAFIGDYMGNFEADSVFMVGPNMPHRWVSEIQEKESIAQRDVVIQFTQQLIDQSIAIFPEMSRLNTLLQRSHSGLRFSEATRQRVVTLMREGIEATPLNRLPILLQILIMLAEAPVHHSQVLSHINDFPQWDDDTALKINRITQSILQRYTEALTVDALAKEFSMAQSTFSRFFKKHTGHNVTAYINKLRIGKACQLLSSVDKPISTIAFDVGYNSLSHFNKNFQHEMSMAARKYREHRQQHSPH